MKIRCSYIATLQSIVDISKNTREHEIIKSEKLTLLLPAFNLLSLPAGLLPISLEANLKKVHT